MDKRTVYTGIAVVLALLVAGYFFFINFFTGALNPTPATTQTQTTMNDQVLIQDVKVGTGDEAALGSQVKVNYVGKLQNGTIFDQSSNHGGPFIFTLGAGQVIKGWDQGIQGMKVGGERILQIPPSLGYGSQQVGPIPPNSTLIFDVELVGVATSSPSVAPEGPQS